MLQKIGFAPGINKQITPTGAESQWVDCDNVRFRYGTPEKIGGWSQLGNLNENELTGAGRGLHHYVNSLGRRYAIIGTNRILYAYSGGVFYDIHPIQTTTTLTSAFSTTNGSPIITLNFTSAHNLVPGDILLMDNFTTITNSNFTSSNFDNRKFMVTSVPTNITATITMDSNESGSGATTSGGIFYDIHPIKSTNTLTNAFSTTNGSPTVTITFSTSHNMTAGDIVLLDNFTTITNSNYTATDFDDKKFMVTTAPTTHTITITMPSNETGSGATTSG